MSRDKASHPHNFGTMIRCHETSGKCWNRVVHCITMRCIFVNMKTIQVKEYTKARSGFCRTAQSCSICFLCMTLNYGLHPFFWCSVRTDTENVCAYHRGRDPQLHVAFPCSPSTLTPLFCCLRFHIWGKNKVLR